MSNKRISQISKSIRRVYNVGKYESLEVVVGYQETVEWETVDERQKKSDSISELLLKDYAKTKDVVFDRMSSGAQKPSNPVKTEQAESLHDIGLDGLSNA